MESSSHIPSGMDAEVSVNSNNISPLLAGSQEVEIIPKVEPLSEVVKSESPLKAHILELELVSNQDQKNKQLKTNENEADNTVVEPAEENIIIDPLNEKPIVDSPLAEKPVKKKLSFWKRIRGKSVDDTKRTKKKKSESVSKKEKKEKTGRSFSFSFGSKKGKKKDSIDNTKDQALESDVFLPPNDGLTNESNSSSADE